MMAFLGLLAGFTLLVCGASWFVTGASALAKRLRVPSMIIGLTVVAFGTSAPELAVSVSASMQGANEIALGNVLGSNLFNVLFILGISCLICPIATTSLVIADTLILFVVSVVTYTLAKVNKLHRTSGIWLTIAYLSYTAWVVLR